MAPEQIIKTLGLPMALIGTTAHLLPLILLSLVFLLWLGRILRGRAARRRCLEILTPVEGETVGLRRKVQGAAHPAGTSVQVLVFSGDRRWHVQPTASNDGYLWTTECQFGLPDKGASESYRLIAVTGEPVNGPISKLPRGLVRSEEVSVNRGK